MTLHSYLLVFYIQTALSAIVALTAFYRFPRRSKGTKLIGLLFAVGFVCNTLGYLLAKHKMTNIPGSAFDLSLVLIVSLIYNYQTKGRYQKWFLLIASVFILFAITNLFLIQKSDNASNNKLLSSFIIILYAIFYFYRLMVEMPTTHIQRLPMFWFNAAFLIYHAGTIFLFAFTSYLIHVLKEDMFTYWSFHNLLNIVEHLIVLLGLFYDTKALSSSEHP